MEIERKWLTQGWPQGAEPDHVLQMDQGYIALRPTVRIRREAEGACVRHVLCFKGQADAEGLARDEIETEISPELFARLAQFIGRPLIRKEQRRYRLEDGLILEDDYNGELRYTARPIPALQGSGRERVVYLGSFSKLLLPSVRISYMVLPPSLLTRYAPRARAYNQTSSKVEQLALADYIREGQLERHLRRMRKLYLLKSRQLQESIRKELGKTVPMALLETALAVVIQVPGARDIAERAAQKGIRVFPVGEDLLRLGFAGIPLDRISRGMEELARVMADRP